MTKDPLAFLDFVEPQASDADVLFDLVREMVLLHHEGQFTREEHEWAEEQWVFKAVATLGALAIRGAVGNGR